MAYKAFDLSGKVALITGGNGGIGLGMADAIAQANGDIAIWGTNEDKNAKAAAQLKAHGVRVYTRKVNVANEQEVVDGMTETAEELGRIDCAFVNAGISIGAPSFTDMPTDTYRKVLSVNLDGAFWTLREATRHMVERAKTGDAGGSLVGLASIAAIEGAARNQAYAATKGGVISMIKATAVEFARYGIRANAILPGWIATDMTSPAQASSAFAEKVIPRVPLQRWGKPEDFGGIAIYLASDASAYQTGTTILVDGGYSIF